MSNHELKTRVESALASHPNLARVSIEVYADRVILVGEVGTRAQEVEAIEAAWGVPGVKEVTSALRILELKNQPTMPLSDALLRQQVEAVLRDHGFIFSNGGIDVSSGEVYLRGPIDTPIRKIQAERLASTVSGVHAVHNELEVRD